MYLWIALSVVLSAWGIIRDKSKAATYFLMLFLFFTMAFNRDTHDYNNYVINFIEFAKGYNLENPEALFILIFQEAAKIIPTYDVFKIILTAAQLCILYCSVRKITERVAFVFALYLLFPAYLDGFHTRFFMGSVLVIAALMRYARKYSEGKTTRKDILLYLAAVIAAALIHSSLLFFAVIPVLLIFQRHSKLSEQKFCMGIVLLFAVVVALRYSGVLYLLLAKIAPSGKLEQYGIVNEVGMSIEEFKIVIYYGFRQALRLALCWFLRSTYRRGILCSQTSEGCGEMGRGTGRNRQWCFNYLSFLVIMNIVAFLIIIFQTYTVNFDRLYRVINILNYTGVAVTLSGLRAYSVSRWRVKIIAVTYALVFALWYYCYSEFYIEAYKLVFTNNVIFNALMG